MQEMALLYRQIAADLSVLRQDATAHTYTAHVNQLLARAHHIIYSGRKTNLLTIFRFLRDQYPVIFQRQIGYVLASVIVSVAWGLLGAASPAPAPSLCATSLAPDDRHHGTPPDVDRVHCRCRTQGLQHDYDQQPLGKLYNLCRRNRFRPGNLLRSVPEWHDAWRHRRGLPPIRHVAGTVELCRPHGSLELPAILIAGGAGFRLGRAMLFPGELRWRNPLPGAASRPLNWSPASFPCSSSPAASKAFLPVEGPIWLKFTVGGLLFTLLLLWLFRPVKANPANA